MRPTSTAVNDTFGLVRIYREAIANDAFLSSGGDEIPPTAMDSPCGARGASMYADEDPAACTPSKGSSRRNRSTGCHRRPGRRGVRVLAGVPPRPRRTAPRGWVRKKSPKCVASPDTTSPCPPMSHGYSVSGRGFQLRLMLPSKPACCAARTHRPASPVRSRRSQPRRWAQLPPATRFCALVCAEPARVAGRLCAARAQRHIEHRRGSTPRKWQYVAAAPSAWLANGYQPTCQQACACGCPAHAARYPRCWRVRRRSSTSR